MSVFCCNCTIDVFASVVMDDPEDPNELISIMTPFDGTEEEATECGWVRTEFGWKCPQCMTEHKEEEPTSDVGELLQSPLTAVGVAAKLGPMLKIQSLLRGAEAQPATDLVEYMVCDLGLNVQSYGDCKKISSNADYTSRHRDLLKMECKGLILDSANRWSVVGMLADEFDYEPEGLVILVFSYGGDWKFASFCPPSVINFKSLDEEDYLRLRADQGYGWNPQSCYTYEVIQNETNRPHFRFVGRRILSSLKSTVQFHG